jgi:phage-related protein
MAQQEAINIKVTVDSKDAQQGVDKLQEGVKQTGEAAKKAESGAKKASGAFASIGNALKSLGIIGLVVRGFEFLQEVLMKNQKVADAFAVAGEFISRVLSDLVEFVVNNFGKVVDLFTKVFNDPMKYVKELGEAIKNNLIERVKSLIDAYGFLGEIIKNVFTGEFDAAAEAAKNFGKEVVDVFTGVDDAFDKGVEVVKNATAAIVEYGKETLEAAKKGVALRNIRATTKTRRKSG